MKTVEFWLAVMVTGCQGVTSDPMAGVKPLPERAPPSWSAAPPNAQVVVDDPANRADALAELATGAPDPGPQDAKPEEADPQVPHPQDAPAQDSKPPDAKPEEAQPRDPAGTGAPDQEAPAADPIDAQRARNEIAFENDYLRLKERLFPAHMGQWLVIVDGRVLPVDGHGRVTPVATFEECLKTADAAQAAPLHRFLFRIGEEGDIVYADLASNPRSIVGSGLKSALGITATFEPAKNEIRWTRNGKSRNFVIDRERIEVLLSDPTGKQSMGTRVADSSGFGGFVALEATTASLLECPKYEIPGRLLLKTSGGLEELRRTRLRVRIPDLEVDELVPAAAWTR